MQHVLEKNKRFDVLSFFLPPSDGVSAADLPPGQRELRRLIEAQLTEQLADLKTNLESQVRSQ